MLQGVLVAALALPLPVRAAPLAQKPAARAQEPVASEPSDDELRRRFQRLPKSLRAEFLEAFRAEIGFLETFQVQLLWFALGTATAPPDSWPALEAPPHFDPVEHAPGDVIRRKVLAPTSSKVKKERERLLGRIPVPLLQSAFVYDYGARELRRIESKDEVARVFENGLHGYPPDLDLATALVELALDDGAQSKALAAFEHAYTDRSGNVYTGITLYDAFASELTIEMPDVDCLGIVHTVLDDWRTWKAPVPDSQHDPLYDRIAELYKEAHRHRSLRAALASTFLVGSPVLRDGYGVNLDALHALWESASSTPADLAPRLPAARDWRAFLDEWVGKVAREPELRAQGERRRAQLDADGRAVRAALVRVLLELEDTAAREKAKGG